LLQLAKPYHQRIKARKDSYAETNAVDSSGRDEWQLEKSLSIASFMTFYAGIESLVNCIHKDFQTHTLDSLPGAFFSAPLDKLKTSLSKKTFGNWYLANRVYLVASLCTDPAVDPSELFSIEEEEWKKFVEIIKIRHTFNHPIEVVGQALATKNARGLLIVDDNFAENFWPLTNVSRDHRTFNYEDASRLGSILEWIIGRLRGAMPTQLNDDYMTKEVWGIDDASDIPPAKPDTQSGN